jgi:hypothetical protein
MQLIEITVQVLTTQAEELYYQWTTDFNVKHIKALSIELEPISNI